jgi:hypothetical protein
MILAIALAMSLQCPQTQIINRSNEPFNEVDRKNMNIAKKRCIVHFPKSPCLVRFYKLGYQSYHATCVAKTNPDSIK